MKTLRAKTANQHVILLGGLGGDSHSVGLTILRRALLANHYDVHYLGTQNKVEDFFQFAALANVVMISCMDGHSRYYLRQFAELLQAFKTPNTLWYLGGNLDIGDGLGFETSFVEMGFKRVFVKFVDIRTLLGTLAQDLAQVEAIAESHWLREKPDALGLPACGPVTDTVLDKDSLKQQRRQVLEGWKTGAGARDLAENAAFLTGQPSFSKLQAMVNKGKARIITQPRSGVPLLEQQIKLFKTFKSVGIRALSYQVDSLTRNNNYPGAEEAIRESRATGIATINGFPVINHGVGGLRRIIGEVRVPLQTRHSTRDPRLLAEISYAGGVTSYEGGAICYNIPYYKNYPLDESIRNWNYVDRLTGLYYEDYGITLDREYFGTLTATLIPPSIAITTNILEAILAARQGVKCVSLGYAEQGHRPQDIAAIRVLDRMAKEILNNLGYRVQVNTVFHQYMAAFPSSAARAAELIYHSAITAALSGATRVIGKTPAEAVKIPTLEDNLAGIDLIHRAIAQAPEHAITEARVRQEEALIRREVECMFDSVILCGKGDIAQGIVSSFANGYLDIPFSPSIYNQGLVMMARDVEGAVRFLSCGNLQLDKPLRQFHEEKMAERRRRESIMSRDQDYLLIERDVMQIARGEYEQWPLCK